VARQENKLVTGLQFAKTRSIPRFGLSKRLEIIVLYVLISLFAQSLPRSLESDLLHETFASTAHEFEAFGAVLYLSKRFDKYNIEST
jgi:hypothetical protein